MIERDKTEQLMTIEQVDNSIRLHDDELNRLAVIREGVLRHIDRYVDLTSRVNFEKKRADKKAQWLKRLGVVRSLNDTLTMQIHELTRQLETFKTTKDDLQRTDFTT